MKAPALKIQIELVIMIIDYLKHIIFYNIGYFGVKLFSLGKYPIKYDSIMGNNFLEILGAIIMVLGASYLSIIFL